MRSKLTPAAFFGAVLLVAATVPSQIVRTILNNGPTSNRYDIVILGDGYRDVDQGRFDQDCLTFIQGLLQKEPYRAFSSYFNVHTVFRASTDAGADHPDASPPIVRNTAYRATYNHGGTARCLYIRNTTLALADAALAPANEGRVLVMVNDPRYGGCAGTFAVSYNGASMVEVQSHEVGHSIGLLADEYDYPNGTYTGGEPSAKNVTTSNTGAKWSHWLGTGGVSAFEGAGYYRYGLWRPRIECLMRNLHQLMCAVCGEQTILRIYERVSTIENPVPASNFVEATRPQAAVFSFTNIAPAASNVAITWSIDNTIVQIGGTTLTVNTGPLSAGTYRVLLEVTDQTPGVRNDPNRVLRKTKPWVLTVRDPATIDLVPTVLNAAPLTVQAGTDISIATTIENRGNTAAGAFRVEHFLSADGTIGVDDVYLGGYDVPSLAGNTTLPQNRPAVRIPAHVIPGNYVLAVWVDRTNQVAESDETNNLLTIPLTVQQAACGPVLTFRDNLLYPPDAATLDTSISTAAVHPTVTAPCDPGARYLILFGCSGTAPGLPLSPSVTLPLNVDPCTELGLMLLNTTYFDLFFGTIGQDGLGHASFRLPGVVLSGPVPGHLSALILAPDLSFVRSATPPVSVVVR